MSSRFLFFRFSLFLLTLLIFSGLVRVSAQSLSPGRYTIGGITVEGADYSDNSTVITLTGLKVGKVITWPSDDLSSGLRKLWKQNLFSDVRLEVDNVVGDKLYLKLKVVERPRISKFTFEGITKGQADDLRDKIKFVRGQRLTEYKRRQAVRTIKNFFIEKGFFDTQVDVKTITDPGVPNGLAVVFKVNRGKRIKIKSIRFFGVEEISPNKLRRKLKETKEKRFYKIWSRSKFLLGKYQEDKQNLISYLQTLGYRDAKIIRDTFYKVDNRNLAIDISLHQGRKYYFRNIVWNGNYKYSSGKLDTMLAIKKGAVYNTSLLERRLMADPNGLDISSLYLDDGYLFFRAEPVETHVEKDSIDLEIRIFEGPQAKYDKIILEGNTKTSDHVILREIKTLPGNKFSRSEIIRSQREILALNYFNQENMQINPIPNLEKGTVDIKYTVEEKPSDQFMMQLGWGGRVRDPRTGVNISSGLIGTVGLVFNNFSTRKALIAKAWSPLPSGDGQRLTLRAQTNGVGFQNYAIGFMEPWFGGKKPQSLGVNMNYSIQQVNSFSLNYRMDILGASLDLGRRLKVPDDYFRSFTSLGYRYYKFQNVQQIFPSVSNGHVNIFSIRQTFDRSSIDVPMFPTRGSNLSFSLELTPPWSYLIPKDYKNLEKSQRIQMLEFHKWKFQSEVFNRLTNVKLPLVLYGRMQFGFLGMYNSIIGMSPFERFYLGGDGLFGFNIDGREIFALRGYRMPNIGPSDGATVYNKFTLELRQAISLAPTTMLWVHGFLEGGNAWARFEQFNPYNLKRSAGVGLRIFLPMFGLLGIDYGYGFDYAPQAQPGSNFHFMIGQQF